MLGRCEFILLGLVTLALGACRSESRDPRREFELRGKVIEVDKGQRKVTIAHEEIPGYMGAMTMPFTVKDDWAFQALAPGRQVVATLVVQGERSWLENIAVSEGSSGSGAAVEKGSMAEPGTEVPDFVLQNQDGKRIELAQFRGSAVLITFIYTRCPLPEYCPLMTNHFLSLYRSLSKEQSLLAATHLLSVSFDPDFDTPAVLRDYAAGYLDGDAPEAFRHWDFATGTKDEVRKMAGFFGLDYWQEGGQIVHSLRTAVISPEGKLVRVYTGNDWTPGELLRDVRALVAP
jgi:protein SCO1/2